MSGPDMRNRSECASCKSFGPKLRHYRKRGVWCGSLLCENCRMCIAIERSDAEGRER